MQGSVLLATAYLPPIEYIIQCLCFKNLLIEQFETYPKQTYRNRCIIATANGLLHLSIPIKKPDGNHTLTRDVEIDFSGRWNQVHWRTIASAYTHSPYFMHYGDHFEALYNDPPKHLQEFNTALLKLVFRLLKTDIALDYTSEYIVNPEGITDLRQLIHPKHTEHYPGKPLSFIPYTQTFSNKYSFIPNLSIIDLLFNEGLSSLDFLKSNQSL
jgi:hypothetical protein